MTVDSNRRWAEGERMRIEQQLMQIVELNNSVAQTKQVGWIEFEICLTEYIATLISGQFNF